VQKRQQPAKNVELAIVVDAPGCLLSIVVPAANIHAAKGGISAAKQALFKSLTLMLEIGGLLSLM